MGYPARDSRVVVGSFYSASIPDPALKAKLDHMGYPLPNTADCVPVRAPSVLSELERSEQASHALREFIGELAKRLEPICGNGSGDEGEDDRLAEPYRPALAQRIHDHALLIEGSIEVIRKILRELEI